MIAAVVAVREDSDSGVFIGFEVDPEVLECGQCWESYRLRYAKEHLKDLAELRRQARTIIASEHPNHDDKIPLR